MVDLGLPLENIWVTDIEGVVYEGRTTLMDRTRRVSRRRRTRASWPR